MLACRHGGCRTLIGKLPGRVLMTRELVGLERTEHGFAFCRGCGTKWELVAA